MVKRRRRGVVKRGRGRVIKRGSGLEKGKWRGAIERREREMRKGNENRGGERRRRYDERTYKKMREKLGKQEDRMSRVVEKGGRGGEERRGGEGEERRQGTETRGVV